MGVRAGLLIAVVVGVTLSAVACTPQTLVGSGTINGESWTVTAFPGDNGDVCYQVVGVAATCDSLREDEKVSEGTTSIGKNNLKVASGSVRPDVATVRVEAGGESVDVATVPLSFRSDLRAYAAAFETDETPRVVGLTDQDGNALPVPTF